MHTPREAQRHGQGEALWYGLFAAGGMVTALAAPIHILLNNLAEPLGLVPPQIIGYDRMAALLAHPMVRLYVLGLVAFALFHWAHRFRYIVMDLGVLSARGPIAFLAYGTAVVGTVAAAVVVVGLP